MRAGGRELPERPRAADLLLAGVATHKLSRLLTKDRVTSFIRAPFTRYEQPAGHGEVEEEPRGSGLRLAIGELLVCPSASRSGCRRRSRRACRGAADDQLHRRDLRRRTVSDVLQLAYKAAEERS